MGNTILGFIRQILFYLDAAIYSFITPVYKFFKIFANAQIFTNETLTTFSNRIYVLVAILMIFKLSFNIINYIIDPDKFNDKKEGFSNLIKNVVIMFVLIIGVPFAFNFAFKLQSAILDDGLIEKVIIGYSSSSDEDIGRSMANAVYKPFFHIDETIQISQEANKAYTDATSQGNMMLVSSYLDDPGNGQYYFYYVPILGAVTLIFVLLMLIVFSLDLALRSVKLGFLQLFAPVAIISIIDGKSITDSKGVFGKWLELVKNTYLGLFIKVAAIAVLVFVISLTPEIIASIWKEGDGVFQRLLLELFLILAAILFAKEAPKLIGDLFGVKLDSSFATMGKMLMGAGAAGAGLLGGAYLGAKGREGGKWDKFKGAASGALTGAKSGWQNTNSAKNMLDAGKGLVKGTAVSKGVYDRNERLAKDGKIIGNGFKFGEQQKLDKKSKLEAKNKSKYQERFNNNMDYKKDKNGKEIEDVNGNKKIDYDQTKLNMIETSNVPPHLKDSWKNVVYSKMANDAAIERSKEIAVKEKITENVASIVENKMHTSSDAAAKKALGEISSDLRIGASRTEAVQEQFKVKGAFSDDESKQVLQLLNNEDPTIRSNYANTLMQKASQITDPNKAAEKAAIEETARILISQTVTEKIDQAVRDNHLTEEEAKTIKSNLSKDEKNSIQGLAALEREADKNSKDIETTGKVLSGSEEAFKAELETSPSSKTKVESINRTINDKKSAEAAKVEERKKSNNP